MLVDQSRSSLSPSSPRSLGLFLPHPPPTVSMSCCLALIYMRANQKIAQHIKAAAEQKLGVAEFFKFQVQQPTPRYNNPSFSEIGVVATLMVVFTFSV